MTTPFQDALLAIEIAVGALHGLRHESREANAAVEDAFAQIKHLGFSVDEPVKDTESRHAAKVGAKRDRPIHGKRLSQRTLF